MATSLRSAKDLKNIVQHARMSNFVLEVKDPIIEESKNHTTGNTTTRECSSIPNEGEDLVRRTKSDTSLNASSDDDTSYNMRFKKKGNATFGDKPKPSEWEIKFRK